MDVYPQGGLKRPPPASNRVKVAFSVVDVTLIRAFVDLGFDGMSPQKRLPVRVRETNILFCDKW